MTTPTPRTDANEFVWNNEYYVTTQTAFEAEHYCYAEFARQLERELAAAQEALAARNKQLGVACMKHDLTHSLACGHCFAARDESLRYVRETLDKARPGMDEGAPIEAIARKVAAHIAARDAELAAMKQRAEAAELELAAMKAENLKLRSALEIVHFKQEPWQ
jgi:hypothetical protein